MSTYMECTSPPSSVPQAEERPTHDTPTTDFAEKLAQEEQALRQQIAEHSRYAFWNRRRHGRR